MLDDCTHDDGSLDEDVGKSASPLPPLPMGLEEEELLAGRSPSVESLPPLILDEWTLDSQLASRALLRFSHRFARAMPNGAESVRCNITQPEWIAIAAHRLQYRWRSINLGQLEDVAAELWRGEQPLAHNIAKGCLPRPPTFRRPNLNGRGHLEPHVAPTIEGQ